MRFSGALVLFGLLATSSAIAQTAPATPAPAAAPNAAAPTGPDAGQTLTPQQQANRDRVKGERDTCRAQARSQGLTGPAIKAAVQDCMAKTDPIAAKRMACMQAGKAKGLQGAELKQSMPACMHAS